MLIEEGDIHEISIEVIKSVKNEKELGNVLAAYPELYGCFLKINNGDVDPDEALNEIVSRNIKNLFWNVDSFAQYFVWGWFKDKEVKHLRYIVSNVLGGKDVKEEILRWVLLTDNKADNTN